MPRVALDTIDTAAAVARVKVALAGRGGRASVRSTMTDLRARGFDVTLTDCVTLLRAQPDLTADDDGSVHSRGP